MTGTIFSMPRPHARPWAASASAPAAIDDPTLPKPPPVEPVQDTARPNERDASTSRRALLERGAAEMVRARRYDRPFALISVEGRVDAEAGAIDGALQDVLEGATRAGADVVIRTGGASFVCLLPETNLSGAMHLAARIQRTLHGLSIGGGTVSSRLGFSALADDDRSFAAMLARSEAMLADREVGR